MMPASFLRLSPLLLLTVALVALAVFFVHDSRPASAEHGGITILSADLRPTQLGSDLYGCRDTGAASQLCTSAARLTDNTFNHNGVSYEIDQLLNNRFTGNTLDFSLTTAIPASLKSDLTLYIDAIPFAGADATQPNNNTLRWANAGLSWSAGDTVDVWLKVPAFTGVELFGGDLTVIDEHSAPTLTVAEGGVATFNVRLTQAPTANVTVSLGKATVSCAGCGGNWHDDVSAGTISKTTMTFTSSNWNVGHTVTVTGVADDDSVHEHFLVLVRVSSIAGGANEGDPFRSPDASSGVYVTVTDGSDDGSQHGGL